MTQPTLPHFNPFDTSEENLRLAIGQLVLAGFEGDDDSPPEHVRAALEDGLSGVILFRRNIRDIEQLVSLNEGIHRAAAGQKLPPFVAVDQEGGRVVRVREPLTPIPPMRDVAAGGDPVLVSEVSEVIATEIQALGFNLNFAPVLDVDTNPQNPIIGDRAFSSDPDVVARLGGAFLLGHYTAGVIPCGKHFPGHGDTLLDSHLDLPVIEHDPERLESVELVPFQKTCKAEIPMLMTAHIKVPALDTVHPATLSHAIIHRLLREELGYDGVVITDDLEMKAVADRYTLEDMIALSLRAGVDIMLICKESTLWQQALNILFELSKNQRDRERIFQSANRVARLKKSLLTGTRPWKPMANYRQILGCDEHRATMQKVEEHGKKE